MVIYPKGDNGAEMKVYYIAMGPEVEGVVERPTLACLKYADKRYKNVQKVKECSKAHMEECHALWVSRQDAKKESLQQGRPKRQHVQVTGPVYDSRLRIESNGTAAMKRFETMEGGVVYRSAYPVHRLSDPVHRVGCSAVS